MEEKGGRSREYSNWTFSGDPADGGINVSNHYLFDERERSILSEFGWTLPVHESGGLDCDENGLPVFDRPSGLVEPCARPESQLPAVVPSPPTAKSGDAAPSLSSSSSEEPPEKPPEPDEKSAEIANNKSKKKGQKRVRLPRFAFMTKSEVDHLEDGYRWRKYGQKAVKNSPYPRSYYRCTNSKCSVKKRVERSCEDPTIVITTYEGQHCHHTVGFSRGISSPHESTYATQFSGAAASTPLYFPTRQFRVGADPINSTTQQIQMRSSHEAAVHARAAFAQGPQVLPTDDGLLDDVVPALMRNR